VMVSQKRYKIEIYVAKITYAHGVCTFQKITYIPFVCASCGNILTMEDYFVNRMTPVPQEIQYVLITICLHMDVKAYVACNLHYRVETELLKTVTFTVKVTIFRK